MKSASNSATATGCPRLLRIIEANRAEYEAWLKEIMAEAPRLQTIKRLTEETDANQPGWNNGFLPGLDIMALYTIIAKTKPNRYVEMGSGNSTQVAHKAIQEHDTHHLHRSVSTDCHRQPRR